MVERNIKKEPNFTRSKREVVKGNTQYDKYFQGLGKASKKVNPDTVHDTVDEIKSMVRSVKNDVKNLAQSFKGSNRKETVNNVWEFLYNFFQYRLDPAGELLRTPGNSWKNRIEGIDCDDYTILGSAIFLNLGIPHAYRISDTKNSQEKGSFNHIYLVVPKSDEISIDNLENRGQYFSVDPVIHAFNREEPFRKKNDTLVRPKPKTKQETLGRVQGMAGQQCDTNDKNPNKQPFAREFDVLNQKSGKKEFMEATHRHFKNTREMLMQSGLPKAEEAAKLIDSILPAFKDSSALKARLKSVREQTRDDATGTMEGLAAVCDGSLKTIEDIESSNSDGLNGVFDWAKNAWNSFKDWFGDKVLDNIIKYNPVFLAGRKTLIEMVKNLEPVEQTMQLAYVDKATAKSKDYTTKQIDEARKQRDKLENFYVNTLRGEVAGFRSAILQGSFPQSKDLEIYQNCGDDAYSKNEDLWLQMREFGEKPSASKKIAQRIWDTGTKAQVIKFMLTEVSDWVPNGACALVQAGQMVHDIFANNEKMPGGGRVADRFGGKGNSNITSYIADRIGNIEKGAVEKAKKDIATFELWKRAKNADVKIRSVTPSKYRTPQVLRKNRVRYRIFNNQNKGQQFANLTRAFFIKWTNSELPDNIDSVDQTMDEAGKMAAKVLRNEISGPENKFLQEAKERDIQVMERGTRGKSEFFGTLTGCLSRAGAEKKNQSRFDKIKQNRNQKDAIRWEVLTRALINHWATNGIPAWVRRNFMCVFTQAGFQVEEFLKENNYNFTDTADKLEIDRGILKSSNVKNDKPDFFYQIKTNGIGTGGFLFGDNTGPEEGDPIQDPGKDPGDPTPDPTVPIPNLPNPGNTQIGPGGTINSGDVDLDNFATNPSNLGLGETFIPGSEPKLKQNLGQLGKSGKLKNKQKNCSDFCGSGFMKFISSLSGTDQKKVEEAAKKIEKNTGGSDEKDKADDMVGDQKWKTGQTGGLGSVVGTITIATAVAGVLVTAINSLFCQDCGKNPNKKDPNKKGSGIQNVKATRGKYCSDIQSEYQANQNRYESVKSNHGDKAAQAFDLLVRAQIIKWAKEGEPSWNTNNTCLVGLAGSVIKKAIDDNQGNFAMAANKEGLSNYQGKAKNNPIKIRTGHSEYTPPKDGGGDGGPGINMGSIAGWGVTLAVAGIAATQFFSGKGPLQPKEATGGGQQVGRTGGGKQKKHVVAKV